MKSIEQNPCPNIVPGMELKASVFHDIIGYINARTSDGISLFTTTNGFGLFKSDEFPKSIEIDSDDKGVSVKFLNAVSPSGNLIFIRPEDGELGRKLFDELSVDKTYRLSVSVGIMPSLGYGPNTGYNDLPERRKYIRPSFVLHWCELSTAQSRPRVSDTIDVAEYKFLNGKWQQETDFLPTCLHVGALPAWSDLLNRLKEKLDKLLESLAIVAYRSSAKQYTAEQLLHLMCVSCGQILGSHRYRYRCLGEFSNPIDVLIPWIEFAGGLSFIYEIAKQDKSHAVFSLIQKNTGNASMKPIDRVRFLEIIEMLSSKEMDYVDWQQRRKNVISFVGEISLMFSRLQEYSNTIEDQVGNKEHF